MTPSHVLAAMGVDVTTAMSTVRFSVGRFTSAREVDEGARRVLAVARELAGEGAAARRPGDGRWRGPR